MSHLEMVSTYIHARVHEALEEGRMCGYRTVASSKTLYYVQSLYTIHTYTHRKIIYGYIHIYTHISAPSHFGSSLRACVYLRRCKLYVLHLIACGHARGNSMKWNGELIGLGQSGSRECDLSTHSTAYSQHRYHYVPLLRIAAMKNSLQHTSKILCVSLRVRNYYLRQHSRYQDVDNSR